MYIHVVILFEKKKKKISRNYIYMYYQCHYVCEMSEIYDYFSTNLYFAPCINFPEVWRDINIIIA